MQIPINTFQQAANVCAAKFNVVMDPITMEDVIACFTTGIRSRVSVRKHSTAMAKTLHSPTGIATMRPRAERDWVKDIEPFNAIAEAHFDGIGEEWYGFRDGVKTVVKLFQQGYSQRCAYKSAKYKLKALRRQTPEDIDAYGTQLENGNGAHNNQPIRVTEKERKLKVLMDPANFISAPPSIPFEVSPRSQEALDKLNQAADTPTPMTPTEPKDGNK